MSKVHDLVTSTKKDVPQTRKGGKHSFMSFRRAGEEEIKLAREEKHKRELAKLAQEAALLRAVEEEQKRVEEGAKESDAMAGAHSEVDTYDPDANLTKEPAEDYDPDAGDVDPTIGANYDPEHSMNLNDLDLINEDKWSIIKIAMKIMTIIAETF